MYDWTSSDRLVAPAARHRRQLLANILNTPRWASLRPNVGDAARYAPRDPAVFREFTGQLVLRYGPNGRFWTQNPTLPRQPVRWWQSWNEQMAANGVFSRMPILGAHARVGARLQGCRTSDSARSCRS